MRRRTLLGALGASSTSLLAGRAAADGLRTARILVGVPAGAPGDLLARSVADKLRGRYADAVLVENMPGASTQLAIGAAVRSPADGSTILLTPSSPLSLFPATFSKLPYRPAEDLKPVSLAAHFNHAFAVGPAVPESISSLSAYLAWAKANPAGANYGTSGVGTIPHLLCVMVSRMSGAQLLNVPYRGSGPAVTDLLGGQISAMSSPIGFFLPHMSSGKIRILAVSGSSRSLLAPAVPTYQELGFPFSAREWLGFFLPGLASAPVTTRANSAFSEALVVPAVAASVAALGLEVAHSTPDVLAGMMMSDATEWQKIVREIGFKADT